MDHLKLHNWSLSFSEFNTYN